MRLRWRKRLERKYGGPNWGYVKHDVNVHVWPFGPFIDVYTRELRLGWFVILWRKDRIT